MKKKDENYKRISKGSKNLKTMKKNGSKLHAKRFLKK